MFTTLTGLALMRCRFILAKQDEPRLNSREIPFRHDANAMECAPHARQKAYALTHLALDDSDMKILKTLFLGLSLAVSGAVLAAEPVVVLHGNTSQNLTAPSNSVDIQQNSGSRCEARAVGNCGSCSVSCPVGQAATCKPGRAVSKDVDASCTIDPSCTCK